MADLKISQLTGATTPLAGTEVLPIVQSSSTKKVAVSDLTAGRSVATGALTATTTASFSPTISAVQTATTAGICSVKATSNSSFVELVAGGSAWATNYMGANEGGLMMQSGTPSGYGMRLNIYNSTNPTFRLSYGSTNVLSTDASGNTTVNIGNLIQGTAAKGINFTANTPAAGMTSQLLNWYEEGTWTPAITFGGAAVGVTYGTRVGRYTRIGNVVSFVFNLTLTSKGSSTGAAVITGLPFTSNATGQSAVTVGYFADLSGLTGAPCARIGASSTSVVISQTAAATAADLFDTHYTNTTFLIVSGQYTV